MEKLREFRHNYQGKPLRHLFTSNWTKFVNAKNLIDGDTIIFIKKI